MTRPPPGAPVGAPTDGPTIPHPRSGVRGTAAAEDGPGADRMCRQPPARFLTTTGQRGQAASVILHGRVASDVALTTVDALDLACGAILSAAGVSDAGLARAVLAVLWATR
jgi:hypothetical protein